MGEIACEQMRTIVMDNMAAQRTAVKQVFPNTTIMLCYFHVRQAANRHVRFYVHILIPQQKPLPRSRKLLDCMARTRDEQK